MTFKDCYIDQNVVLKEHFPEISGVYFDISKKDLKQNLLVLDVFKGINNIHVSNEGLHHPLNLALLSPPSEEMRSNSITLFGNILLSDWGFLSKIAKKIDINKLSMKETLEIPAFETFCEKVEISALPILTKVDLHKMSNLKTLTF